MKAQPITTKVADALGTHAPGIHFHPLRLKTFIKESALPTSPLIRYLFHSNPLRFGHLTEVGNYQMTRTVLRPVGLDQLLVHMVLLIPGSGYIA